MLGHVGGRGHFHILVRCLGRLVDFARVGELVRIIVGIEVLRNKGVAVRLAAAGSKIRTAPDGTGPGAAEGVVEDLGIAQRISYTACLELDGNLYSQRSWP